MKLSQSYHIGHPKSITCLTFGTFRLLTLRQVLVHWLSLGVANMPQMFLFFCSSFPGDKHGWLPSLLQVVSTCLSHTFPHHPVLPFHHIFDLLTVQIYVGKGAQKDVGFLKQGIPGVSLLFTAMFLEFKAVPGT